MKRIKMGVTVIASAILLAGCGQEEVQQEKALVEQQEVIETAVTEKAGSEDDDKEANADDGTAATAVYRTATADSRLATDSRRECYP